MLFYKILVFLLVFWENFMMERYFYVNCIIKEKVLFFIEKEFVIVDFNLIY